MHAWHGAVDIDGGDGHAPHAVVVVRIKSLKLQSSVHSFEHHRGRIQFILSSVDLLWSSDDATDGRPACNGNNFKADALLGGNGGLTGWWWWFCSYWDGDGMGRDLLRGEQYLPSDSQTDRPSMEYIYVYW